MSCSLRSLGRPDSGQSAPIYRPIYAATVLYCSFYPVRTRMPGSRTRQTVRRHGRVRPQPVFSDARLGSIRDESGERRGECCVTPVNAIGHFQRDTSHNRSSTARTFRNSE